MEYLGDNYHSKYKDHLRQQNAEQETYQSEDGNLRSEYSRKMDVVETPSGNIREQTIEEIQNQYSKTGTSKLQNDDKNTPLYQRNFYKLLYGAPVGQYHKYSLEEHVRERRGPTVVKDSYYADKTINGGEFQNSSYEPLETQISERKEPPTLDKVVCDNIENRNGHIPQTNGKLFHAPYHSPLLANRKSPVVSRTTSKTMINVGVQVGNTNNLSNEEKTRLEDIIAGLRKLLSTRDDNVHDLQTQMLDMRNINRGLKDDLEDLKAQGSPADAADNERKLVLMANEKDIMASKVARLNDEIQYLKNKYNRNHDGNPPDINALLKKIADLEGSNSILTEANEIAASELIRRDKQIADILCESDKHKHGFHDDRYCPYKYKPYTTSSMPSRESYRLSPRLETHKTSPKLDHYKMSPIRGESHRSPSYGETYKLPISVESYNVTPSRDSYKYTDSYKLPATGETYRPLISEDTYKSRYTEKHHHNGYSRDVEETINKTPMEYSRNRSDVMQNGSDPRKTSDDTNISGMPYRSRSVQSLHDLSGPSDFDTAYKSTFPELSKYSSLNAGGDFGVRRKYPDDNGEISDTPTDILLNANPMERVRSKPEWKIHSVSSDSSLSDVDEGYHTIYRKRSKSVLGRGRYDDALQTTPVETGRHHLTSIRPSASMEGLAPANHKVAPHRSTAGFRSIQPTPLITQQNKHLYSSSTGTISLSNSITQGMRPFSPSSPADIQTNDIVKFSRQGGKLSMGSVRFIGNLPGRSGVYLGVELHKEEGKHDGTYGDVRYFKCKANKGVFVAFNKIVMAWTSN